MSAMLTTSCLALTASIAFAGDPITFSEDDFGPGSYTTEVINGGGGGSSTVSLIPAGGAPDAYLSIRHDLAGGAPEDGFCARWVWTFFFMDGAVIDPGAFDGVGSIDWSMQSLPIDSNTSGLQSQALAVRQNGVIYVSGGGTVTSGQPGWTLGVYEDLVEEDFFELVNMAPCEFVNDNHPDFSPSGAPIELGFARGNSTSIGGGDGSFTTVGADAWSVTIHPAEPADCPADLDNDGMVGPSDLAILLAAWNAEDSPADLDGSGVVDPADLAAMLAAWGPCG